METSDESGVSLKQALPEADVSPPYKEVWGYGDTSGEDGFHGAFDTKEEALDAALEEYDDGHADEVTFSVQKGRMYTGVRYMPNAEQVLEHLVAFCDEDELNPEQLQEMVDDVTPGAHRELDILLETWAAKHLKVHFWELDGRAEVISRKKE